MNKTTVGLLAFIGGGIVGAVVGVLATRQTFQKQCNEMCDEIRKYYASETREAKEAAQAIGEQYMEKVYGSRKDFKPPEPIAYHKIYSQYLKDKPEYIPDPEEDMHPEDTDEPDLPVRPSTPDSDPEPYIITEEEFFHDDGLFVRDNLTYWVKDDLLTDDHDDEVDKELVGIKNLQTLVESDEEVIYVKNYECGMKWEICKELKSWEAYYSGVPDGPKDG